MRNHPRNAQAVDMLAGPPLPDTARYLWDWLQEIRRGVGIVAMVGIAPLTYGALRDWSHFTGKHPDPEETELLFSLDAVLRNPPETLEGFG